MYPFSKCIHVAVIGTPSSGKSYLLYDFIHAFSLLGYRAMELPLSYPHSSFGAYFHDVFNPQTGGLRGTEPYICRPENHYGAYLTLDKLLRFPYKLKVDFLNIPGEAFTFEPSNGGSNGETTIKYFFKLKSAIEMCREGYFCLSLWKSPAGHIRKIVMPKGMFLKASDGGAVRSSSYRFRNFLKLDELQRELEAGKYKHVKDKNISGQYILNHFSELDIDSVILSIKEKWKKLPGGISMEDIYDYESCNVFTYFYPLVYCQNATDIIICDRLTVDTKGGELSEKVSDFMFNLGTRRPHAYLAFREADVLLKRIDMRIMKGSSVMMRNKFYSDFLDKIMIISKDRATLKATLDINIKSRIMKCIGSWENSFMKLLRTSYGNERVPHFIDEVVPPHVYFTATPIDSDGHIYNNDEEDKTRFIYDGGKTKKSFVREVSEEMSQHYCFGTLQLLIDILLQNGMGMDRQTKESFDDNIKYFQGKTI